MPLIILGLGADDRVCTSFSNNDLVCECMVNSSTINLRKEIYQLETIF